MRFRRIEGVSLKLNVPVSQGDFQGVAGIRLGPRYYQVKVPLSQGDLAGAGS